MQTFENAQTQKYWWAKLEKGDNWDAEIVDVLGYASGYLLPSRQRGVESVVIKLPQRGPGSKQVNAI